MGRVKPSYLVRSTVLRRVDTSCTWCSTTRARVLHANCVKTCSRDKNKTKSTRFSQRLGFVSSLRPKMDNWTWNTTTNWHEVLQNQKLSFEWPTPSTFNRMYTSRPRLSYVQDPDPDLTTVLKPIHHNLAQSTPPSLRCSSSLPKQISNVYSERCDIINYSLSSQDRKSHRLNSASFIIKGERASIHGIDIAIDRNVIQQASTSNSKACALLDGTGSTCCFACSRSRDCAVDEVRGVFPSVVSLDVAVQACLCWDWWDESEQDDLWGVEKHLGEMNSERCWYWRWELVVVLSKKQKWDDGLTLIFFGWTNARTSTGIVASFVTTINAAVTWLRNFASHPLGWGEQN